jgi:hypothetical protein
MREVQICGIEIENAGLSRFLADIVKNDPSWYKMIGRFF